MYLPGEFDGWASHQLIRLFDGHQGGQMYVWLVVSKNQNIFKWYGDVIKQQHYWVWDSSKEREIWGESFSWFSDDLMNTMALDGRKGNARPEVWKKGVYAKLVHWNRTQLKKGGTGTQDHTQYVWMCNVLTIFDHSTSQNPWECGRIKPTSRLAVTSRLASFNSRPSQPLGVWSSRSLESCHFGQGAVGGASQKGREDSTQTGRHRCGAAGLPMGGNFEPSCHSEYSQNSVTCSAIGVYSKFTFVEVSDWDDLIPRIAARPASMAVWAEYQ